MKKTLVVLTLAGMVGACEKQPEYKNIHEYIASENCETISTIPEGDSVLKCAPHEIFAPVLASEKNAMFLRGEFPGFDITTAAADTEHVYVNMVPQFKEIRILVPGAEIAPDVMYAVFVRGE